MAKVWQSKMGFAKLDVHSFDINNVGRCHIALLQPQPMTSTLLRTAGCTLSHELPIFALLAGGGGPPMSEREDFERSISP